MQSIVRTLDSKGRISLGGLAVAGQTMIVRVLENNDIVLTPATVIPERELWLHHNAEALAAVQQGVLEARSQLSVTPPDLEADAEIARRMNGE